MIQHPILRRIVTAAFCQAIPLCLALLVTCEIANVCPTWLACGCLIIGSAVAWSLHALNRDRAALCLGAVTIIAVAVCLAPRIHVRAATANDKIYERYFGAPPGKVVARNIAVTEGTFTLNTWLTASLYHVQGGKVRELNSLTVGRTSNAVGSPPWTFMRITLALVAYDSENGPMTTIASGGQSRGGGNSNEISTTVEAKYRQTVPVTFLSSRSQILYVEGDSPFTLTPDMSVESFATANPGTFYVVLIGLN